MAQCGVCGGPVAQDGRCVRCGALNFDAQTDATPVPPRQPSTQRPAYPQPPQQQAPQSYPQQPPPQAPQSYPQQPAQYRVVTGRPPTPIPEIRFSEDPQPHSTPPASFAPMDLRERPLPPPPDFEPSLRGSKSDRLSIPLEVSDEGLIEGFESTRIEGQDEGPRRPQAPVSAQERRRRNAPPSAPPPTYTACPRCGTPLASLNAAFCEACGGRIPRSKKAPVAVATRAAPSGETTKCRECGYRTPSERSHCGNCGNALPSP